VYAAAEVASLASKAGFTVTGGGRDGDGPGE